MDPTGWTLLSVIVGGFIGALSSVGAVFAQSWLHERRDKLRLRAERLQSLVTALHEQDHWLDCHRNSLLFDGPSVGLDAFANIEAITAIYFPQLRPEVSWLREQMLDLRQWAIAASQKKMGGEKEYGAGFKEVYRKYYDANDALLAKIRELALAR